MGARLVGLVLACWTDLPDRQFRILVRMAWTALDDPQGGTPAETYWGGHEPLAMTLRCGYPDGDGEEARKARAGVLHHVRREVAALRKAGACQVVDTGRPVRQGHRQRYLLTLGRPDRAGAHAPSSQPDRAGPQGPPSAGPQRPPSAGPKSAIEQGRRSPPEDKEEPSQEPTQEPSGGPVVDGSVEDRTRAREQTSDQDSGSSPGAAPGPAAEGRAPRTRRETEAARRRQHDALREWQRAHPEADQ